MNISITARKFDLNPETEASVREKLSAPFRLLGDDSERALLEIEVEEAPPEGRSSTPCKLVAVLSLDDEVFHAEAVKPNPESAADRVRSELESAIRRSRGRTRKLFRDGGRAIKQMLRFGR